MSDDFQQEAIAFAKAHKREIAERLTDTRKFPSELETPVTIFTAGSPGAGKTEFLQNLVLPFSAVLIDPDALRSEIPGYTGSNSYEVQGAVSILVGEIYERVLKQKQNCLFDGTFANYHYAKENVERALKRHRRVRVFYVYQEPVLAWQITQVRESIEGRNIPKDVFAQKFVDARTTVERVLSECDEPNLAVYFVRKDFDAPDGHSEIMFLSRTGVQLDDLLPHRYTQKEIFDLL